MQTLDEKHDLSLRPAAIDELVDELETARDVAEGAGIFGRYGRQRWLLYHAGELGFDLDLVDQLRDEAFSLLETAVEVANGTADPELVKAMTSSMFGTGEDTTTKGG
jgi:hypothetical protein